MKGLVWFLAGLGAAVALGQLVHWRYARVSQLGLDLNAADRSQLLGLGLDDDSADRVIDNRPYRSKLDLLSRFVVPDDVYREIKDRVFVDDTSAHRAVGVA
jgi:hypothetical protein